MMDQTSGMMQNVSLEQMKGMSQNMMKMSRRLVGGQDSEKDMKAMQNKMMELQKKFPNQGEKK